MKKMVLKRRYINKAEFLTLKCLGNVLVVPLSHIFFVIRNCFLITGFLPNDDQKEQKPIIFYPVDKILYVFTDGRYKKSLGAHMLSTILNTLLSETLFAWGLKLFNLSETEKNHMDRGWLQRSSYRNIIRVVVAFLSNSILFPLTTVRTRLGAQGCCAGLPMRYTGLLDCVEKIYREEGLTAFYTGFWAHSLYVVAQVLWISLIYALGVGMIEYELYEEEDLVSKQ